MFLQLLFFYGSLKNPLPSNLSPLPSVQLGQFPSSRNLNLYLLSDLCILCCLNHHKNLSDLYTSSAVMRLTMCQAANGSFPHSSDICCIMGLTIEKVLEAGKDISTDYTFPTIWMTLVVTMFLTEKCAEQKYIW